MEEPKRVNETMKCEHCYGLGYTSEHSLHPHPDGDCCGECPVQVQCERCHGEGYYMTIDVVRVIESDLTTLQAENERLREALKKFGDHLSDCDIYANPAKQYEVICANCNQTAGKHYDLNYRLRCDPNKNNNVFKLSCSCGFSQALTTKTP